MGTCDGDWDMRDDHDRDHYFQEKILIDSNPPNPLILDKNAPKLIKEYFNTLHSDYWVIMQGNVKLAGGKGCETEEDAWKDLMRSSIVAFTREDYEKKGCFSYKVSFKELTNQYNNMMGWL
jgi:hypothetical protein